MRIKNEEKYIGKSKSKGNILLLTTKELTCPLRALLPVPVAVRSRA